MPNSYFPNQTEACIGSTAVKKNKRSLMQISPYRENKSSASKYLLAGISEFGGVQKIHLETTNQITRSGNMLICICLRQSRWQWTPSTGDVRRVIYKVALYAAYHLHEHRLTAVRDGILPNNNED